MVDVTGHLGLALIALSPIWIWTDERTALTFVALGLPFGMLPDVDLELRKLFSTVHHHGVTHTLVFVALVSLVTGVVAARTILPALRSRGYLSENSPAVRRPVGFATTALFVASAAHLFGDILSAPDISQPIEPLWPLVQGSVGIDVVYYDSNPVNYGLFLAGILLNVGLWWYGTRRL
jgi:hypothetical protein